MGAEKLRILGNHFRLEPQAKFQPALMGRSRHALEALFQLVRIDKPIAQTAVVVIALAEPAIIEH